MDCKLGSNTLLIPSGEVALIAIVCVLVMRMPMLVTLSEWFFLASADRSEGYGFI